MTPRECFGRYENNSNICGSCPTWPNCEREAQFRKRKKRREGEERNMVEGYWREIYHEEKERSILDELRRAIDEAKRRKSMCDPEGLNDDD